MASATTQPLDMGAQTQGHSLRPQLLSCFAPTQQCAQPLAVQLKSVIVCDL